MDITTILSIIGTIATVAVIVGTAMYKLGSRLARIEKDIKALRSEVRSGFNRLADVITNTNVITIDYLGLRGILDLNEVRFLGTVIKRLVSTVTTNPLTEAERKRLLELVDKDDLTIEEAEEFYTLARKLYREYIGKTPDAAYALLYATYKRREAYMRHGGQQTKPSKTQS
ncbi:MAG: hypothetical protein RQ842_10710 [Vulcanisaeta sp.]|nr:hypothetical protein [Vulcanisaeta sp.]